MAEGGTLSTDQLNKDSTVLIYQLLNCPICLEQMRRPKSLPCLHSFCEECLSTYIVTDLSSDMAAVTSFPCPVCRKITSPVNHSERKETWAQQFPTNSLVQNLTNTTMTPNEQRNCGPCMKTKELETPATMLCQTSGMLFCEQCKVNLHDKLHEACDIVTLNEANHKETLEQQSQMSCSKHNLTMDYHCENHKLIGCKECMTTYHQRCDDIMTIQEYFEKKKKSLSLNGMTSSLFNAVKCIQLMVNFFDEELNSLQRCQDVGLSSISDIRQRINSYLDKKQEEITHEMISKCKAEKTKVDLSKQKCSRLGAAIQNTKEASRTALRTDDQRAMIQLFHRGQAEISACNDIIADIVYPSKSVSIVHDIGTNIITTQPSTTLPLGKISVEEQPCIIPDRIVYVQNVDSLSESRAKKIGTYKTHIQTDRKRCIYHGVLLMPNGNIVLGDNKNDKLKLFTFRGSYLNESVVHRPHDVCLVDDDTVAVAAYRGIHVFKVQKSKLTLLTHIEVQNIECRGIAFMDGRFIVSTPQGIISVTKTGQIVYNQKLSAECWHLASYPKMNHTFACSQSSTLVDNVVTRLPYGVQIYGLAGRIVKGPMGVDVDREGNVYVCGQDSNNVVQISANGTNVRELLTSEDGINMPRAISVCGNKFVVSNESEESSDTYFKFVSNEMHVHVYQLY